MKLDKETLDRWERASDFICKIGRSSRTEVHGREQAEQALLLIQAYRELEAKNQINKMEADRLADQLRQMDEWIKKKNEALKSAIFRIENQQKLVHFSIPGKVSDLTEALAIGEALTADLKEGGG